MPTPSQSPRPVRETTPPPSREKEQAVAGKALLRVVEDLDLSPKELGAILGLSSATTYRLLGKDRPLEIEQKEGELALLLIRVYRSLVALVGTAENARAWLRSANRHLGAPPADLLQTVEGLARVATYLDAMRGKV